MTDLISRKALLAAINASQPALPDEYNDIILEAEPTRPQVVANITGGMLQGASADYPVDLYVLDFDLDYVDYDTTGIEVDGDRCHLGQVSADVDPDFVRRVVEAPEVYLHDGSLVE